MWFLCCQRSEAVKEPGKTGERQVLPLEKADFLDDQ